MLAKREEAKKETQKREAARTAWEVEKQKDAQAKTSAEMARRRTLSEHRRLQENRRVSTFEVLFSILDLSMWCVNRIENVAHSIMY